MRTGAEEMVPRLVERVRRTSTSSIVIRLEPAIIGFSESRVQWRRQVSRHDAAVDKEVCKACGSPRAAFSKESGSVAGYKKLSEHQREYSTKHSLDRPMDQREYAQLVVELASQVEEARANVKNGDSKVIPTGPRGPGVTGGQPAGSGLARKARRRRFLQ